MAERLTEKERIAKGIHSLDVFNSGYDAFLAGTLRSANPMDWMDSQGSCDWNAGWLKAEHDQKADTPETDIGAFNQGVAAYQAGVTEDQNPYDSTRAAAFHAWALGWLRSKQTDSKPLLRSLPTLGVLLPRSIRL